MKQNYNELKLWQKKQKTSEYEIVLAGNYVLQLNKLFWFYKISQVETNMINNLKLHKDNKESAALPLSKEEAKSMCL